MDSTTNSEVLFLSSRSQDVSYLYVATLAVVVHDWLILFDCEVEHIWQRSWSVGKILFIIARYGPLLDLSTIAIMLIAPRGAIGDETCVTLYKISTWSTFFGIAVSECILVLRTNAIYSGSKRVIIPLATAYVIGVAAGIAITWRSIHTAFFVPLPGTLLRGCYHDVRSGGIMFYDFVILLVIELAVVVLTVSRGYNDFSSGTPLLRLIYRDSIAFFLVLFALSFSAILVIALPPRGYRGIVASFTRAGHSIVCCRILLNLKQAASRRSESPDVSTRSMVFAAPPQQRTDQTEMSRLDAYGTGSDEVHRSRANGILVLDGHRRTGGAESNDDA